MQGKHLFEYAVIRVVPRVEREEFVNAGVILYCRKPAFLETRVCLPRERLIALCAAIDIEEVRVHLDALQQISAGIITAGPISTLDAASRFRWLTAKRSTILQASVVHPGLCDDPATMIERLYQQLVL